MESRIQFRVDESVKKLAQAAAERRGITLSDACRDLAISLAEEQKRMDAHDSWLTDEINKAYEKMLLGKTEFYSSDSAEQIMALRKKRVKAKQLISN
ncbi:type II toxin-antitoxin system RelB/DinJ family antitoxin [Salmonella enterica subsp. enterica]|uniref:Damage-inducible protein J n=2 Tax=Vibrio cholerae TaxID=666 RepID=A0ABD7SQH5_VIBCL|nr:MULTISPECIES: type II toxin-antitoxin system RelB/DinJ family antitoxin [Vibrio]EGR0487639.1 damage-inducible protein J [Vibrio cholerae]EGR1020643.1 damage-inducible protein J [Vibrio cholerae]EGR2018085.1 damage-inducible protein J [Vibrio cholerae]EGR2438986.1 damage-inducible protein J [Vibrio cholerae]EGR2446377.1 damage-inducible protein J [Vibrio cholerae]